MSRLEAIDIALPPARPVQLEAVKRATLKDQSYASLRRALLAGRFEPGEQVSIRQLSEQLAAGVMPVREAVQRLIAEGALASLPTGRVCVPRLSREAFDQILELRLMLEPLSAEKAARGGRTLEAALLEWQAGIETAVRSNDAEAMLWANYQFHFAIYDAAGAPLIRQHIESLWLRNGPMLMHLFHLPKRKSAFLRHGPELHGALVRALGARDGPGAKTAMREVIEAAAEWHRDTFTFAETAPDI